jgi:hypothetical protein
LSSFPFQFLDEWLDVLVHSNEISNEWLVHCASSPSNALMMANTYLARPVMKLATKLARLSVPLPASRGQLADTNVPCGDPV